MQVKFPWSRVELVNSTAHATVCSAGRKKCTFLGGNWDTCLEDLRNFWADQLTAAKIYENSRLSSPIGENYAIFARSVD